MNKKAHDELKIDNLIYKLNHLATQRKEIFDRLWVLEEEAEQMRLALIKLINEREKC